MDSVLIWRGTEWRKRPIDPGEVWFSTQHYPGVRFLPAAVPEVTRADLMAATAALRANPRVLAVLAPAALTYCYDSDGEIDRLWESGERLRAADAVWTRTAYEPLHDRQWQSVPWTGGADAAAGWAWVRLDYSGWLAILHHELWHTLRPTVDGLLTGADAAAVDDYEDAVRAVNDASLYAADRRGTLWLAGRDEPTAWAYERWATGGQPPFGVPVPKVLTKYFSKARQGELA